MKTFSRLALAAALACLFSLPARADGDIHTTITDPPPASSMTQTTQTNESVSQTGADTTTQTDIITEALIETLPTLLAAL